MLQFKTEWTDCDNVVIMLYEKDKPYPVGIVEVKVFKNHHKGKAYIWNLFVAPMFREKGYGKALMTEAYDVAVDGGCDHAELEWDLRDSPGWVLAWYIKMGFDEKEIGQGYELLRKDIKG